MSKPTVVDVQIEITCLTEDAHAVKESLNQWFCENETVLVQRPRTGGIHVSNERPLREWMRETFGI